MTTVYVVRKHIFISNALQQILFIMKAITLLHFLKMPEESQLR